MINKQKGNMYAFVTHTWNPIKGECSHDCKYCYMKLWKQKPLRLVESDLNDNLGQNNFIFVGSSTDMFADDVNYSWIMRVLKTCCKYPENTYLFQTKNPKRFNLFESQFPPKNIFGITLETNRDNDLSKSPSPVNRAVCLSNYKADLKMVTIEPIIDFDIDKFIIMIKNIKPEWINIGADSKGHNLQEPSKEKVFALIDELKKITDVKIKSNLKRIINE